MPALQFFVMDELTGQQTGPFSLLQIQEQIQARQLKKKDFVRRADSAQWGKASVILAKVFENVEQQKKEQKNQAKEKKAARKRQNINHKDANVQLEQPAETPVQPEQPKVREKTVAPQARNNYKPSFRQMIFGSTRPSPYAGFKFVSILINVLIVLTLIALFLSTVGYMIGLAIVFYECFEERWTDTRIATIITLAVYLVSQWVGTIVWIGLLVFTRNLIDWLIDVEDHARAIRNHFQV